MNGEKAPDSSNPILWVVYAGIAIGLLVGLIDGKPGQGLMLGIFTGFCLFVYLLPSYLAVSKKHQNTTAIVALNILLGWLLVPWIACLVWALARNAAAELLAAQQAQHAYPPPNPPPTPPTPRIEPSDGGADASFYGAAAAPPPSAPKAIKTCPYCAEEILAAAIKCKHCGSDIPNA